ncbi:MAG: hypothetical protein JSU92_00040 [Deltaproteobacteria bacterium]|nr:MAG: hypothetical protein JSU92_00040 [Deltaproteobacteria bacterium]
MPDLVTHFSVAYILVRWTKVLKYSATFYLGTILPDILTRSFFIPFPKTYWVVSPFHTPIPLFFTCWLIAYLFEERLRKGILISLVTGAYLHLLIDFFQKYIVPEHLLLFPFSWKTFGFGLFWPEESLYAIPLLLLLILITEFISMKYRVRGN